jgi:mono/diheme cytochrome c family protein
MNPLRSLECMSRAISGLCSGRGSVVGCMVLAIWLAVPTFERAGADGEGAAPGEGALYSEAQANRGERVYEDHCSTCHGLKLQGNPGAPLAGEAFLTRWADGQHTLDDLFYVLRAQMPYNEPGKLTKQQYADVMAYVLKVNGYPAGRAELPPSPAALKKLVLRRR